jgi:hypothetical protein
VKQALVLQLLLQATHGATLLSQSQQHLTVAGQTQALAQQALTTPRSNQNFLLGVLNGSSKRREAQAKSQC